MTQREEFEAWADANWAYIDLIEDAWTIWQAAQAAQPAQLPDNPCLNDYVDKTIRAHMAKLEANGYRLVPVEPLGYVVEHNVEPVGYAYAPDGDFDGCVIKKSSFHAETALYNAPPDTEALRKEPKTCQHCKHWRKDYAFERLESCKQFDVRDMIEADGGACFEPPADFGCNRWEAKV